MPIAKNKSKKNHTHPEVSLTDAEMAVLIREGEKEPFYPLGTFDEFRNKIMLEWEKKYDK
jgi:hypothetical protein